MMNAALPFRRMTMPQLRNITTMWFWSATAALFATSLIVLQDLLYGGLPAETPLRVALAQYALPWLTWAALAPLIFQLFAQYPIDLAKPLRAVALYFTGGVLVVGVKLIITAPAAALLIWRPLGVGWPDGIRWLLANRAASNLVIFWLLASAYTAYRYYTMSLLGPPAAALPLLRVPVRVGETTTFVALADITHFEAERSHVVLHTRGGRHTLRVTLHDLERRLPPSFLRIHRSRVVNTSEIERIEPWGRGDYVVVMRDGTRLVTGKTYRSAMRSLLDISGA